MDGGTLLWRLSPLNTRWRSKLDEQLVVRLASNLRLIRNRDGEISGRACVTIPLLGIGALTAGGLFANELIGIAGVLTGTPERASRDRARPDAEREALVAWASEQASLIPQAFEDPEDQASCALIIRQLGGRTGDLPIARWKNTMVSYNEILGDSTIPDELFLVEPHYFSRFGKLAGFSSAPNVMFVSCFSWQGIVNWENRWHLSWPIDLFDAWGYGELSIETNLGGAVVEALASVWETTPPQILSASNYKTTDQLTEELTFGHLHGEDLKGLGLMIRRPA